MKLIVITPSNTIEHEHSIIGKMLEMGLPSLHVRKPKFSKEELKDYLSGFSVDQIQKMIIHTHFELLWSFDLKGIHMPGKYRRNKFKLFFLKAGSYLRRKHILIGTSCKSLSSLSDAYKHFDYVAIAPVFPSFNGHVPGFSMGALVKIIPTCPGKVIARGGATIENIKTAYSVGFSGVAFDEYIWDAPDPLVTFQNVLNAYKEQGLPIE